MTLMISEVEELRSRLHSMALDLAGSIAIRSGMQVLDVGCGQGTFTVCVAKFVGRFGKVTAVDITDHDLEEFAKNLERYDVKPRVEFVRADAAELSSVLAPERFDMAVGYRLIEELKQSRQLPRIVSEVVKAVKPDGTVAMMELSTETRTIGEENLIRLHRDIGKDFFPSQRTVLRCMKNACLADISIKPVKTNVWYSAQVFLRSDIGQDQVWPEFEERITRELWPSVEQYGLKYPDITVFSGRKA